MDADAFGLQRSKMKIVKIMGGLGNQMFQYAFGLALSTYTGEDVLFDKTSFEIEKKQEVNNSGFNKDGVAVRDYELDIFNLDIKFATKKQIKQCINERIIGSRIPGFLRKIFKESGQISNNIITESVVNVYEQELFDIKGDAYYQGYFQCEKYFNNIDNLIRKAFEFPPASSQKNQDIIEQIFNSKDAVSLHVRRGDYLNLAVVDKDLCCPISYYQKAIDYIKQNTEEPKFFVFSDDIEWTKENIDTGCQTFFIDFNKDNNSFEDLRLMSLCKHNILANSSFSWWGGWLNNNPNKIVIAPTPWVSADTNHICDSWVQIQKI